MINEQQIPPTKDGDNQNGENTNTNTTPTETTAAPPADTATSAVTNNVDFKTLQAELENTRGKLAELTQISQQALADLQNYKKRTEEEKIKFVAFANAALISELLPVMDDLDRAISHLPEDPAGREWANGIAIIFKKLQDILTTQGLETIPTTGNPFDPALHEAMLMEEGPPDQVVREMDKGYRLAERVLRRAKVVVGHSPAPSSSASEAGTEANATSNLQ